VTTGIAHWIMCWSTLKCIVSLRFWENSLQSEVRSKWERLGKRVIDLAPSCSASFQADMRLCETKFKVYFKKLINSLTLQSRWLKYVNFYHLLHLFFLFLTKPILWSLQAFFLSIEDLIGFVNNASLTILEHNASLISKRISRFYSWTFAF
jgi:hypothetical protein